MNIRATELNKRPGMYLDQAAREPVVVEKMGRPFVVMISYERYNQLEDAYWGELALQADQEPALTTEETMQFLLGDGKCQK